MKNTLTGAVEVTFRRRGRSGRVWVARFDMGSAAENTLAILREAWSMNSEILSTRVLALAA